MGSFLSQKQWALSHLILFGVLVLVALQFAKMTDTRLKLSFLDIGQGDAILIQTPNHHNILVDAGPDSTVVDRLGETLGFFDKTIDLFVTTHPDKDHYAGILDVLGPYHVRQVMMTGLLSEGALYRSFVDALKAHAVPVVFANNHQDIQLGPNLYLDVLFPLAEENWVGKTVQNKNNTSIVARLVRGGKSLAMLTGDAESPEEREIMLAGQEVASTILKLGHHGSRSSTSPEWLKAVHSTTVVVSAGRNNQYGHPHPETMERVKDLEVRSTQKEGTVSLSF